MTETLISDLLARWEELCRDGQMVSAEELCQELGHDSPELIALVEQRMREVVTVGRLMTVGAADTTLEMGRSAGIPDEPLMPRPTDDEVIFSVGQYDYFKFLAKGGVGEVYQADDKDFGRGVALKFMQRDQADRPESKGQFLVEGEVTARLEHPGIVPVYGFGYTSDGRPFHVMRLIRGTTLGDRIESYHREVSSLDPPSRSVRFRELLTRFISVCNTIAYAHNRGILHRDIKPENVMLGKYGETLVVDWGLAHPIPRSDAARDSGETTLKPGSGDFDAELCFAKGIVGTPCYMSPEQAEGKDELTAATDTYSLGALLYRILCGKSAIQGTHIGHILAKVKLADFPPPREVDHSVPKPLEAICLKAMSKEPADRYKTPLDLAADIERWLADESVSVYHETPQRRLARWARRHRTATQVVAVSLVMFVLVALGIAIVLAKSYRSEQIAHQQAKDMTRRLEDLAQREADALEGTLRTTAHAVAQNVFNNIESRRGVLERLARDRELVQYVKTWNEAQAAGDLEGQEVTKAKLNEWLNNEFDRELPVTAEQLEELDAADDRYGNWFVNDQLGMQIARASVLKSEQGQLTVGKYYFWRSYFSGEKKDSQDFKERVARIEASGASDSDVTRAIQSLRVEPLRNGPYLGAVYVADQFAVLKVPLSMPIFDPDDNNKVIGVLGMATDIGHFPALQELDVFLVDLREDYLSGRSSGLILHHPKLSQYYAGKDLESANFKYARFTDSDTLSLISGRDLRSTTDEIGTGLIKDVMNPITGQGHSLAAYCPVNFSARWYRETPDTPCWSVIVCRKAVEQPAQSPESS